MVYETVNAQRAAVLFQGCQNTMITACLKGVMGSLYGDKEESPASAVIRLGDFCFYAGVPNRELALYNPKEGGRDFRILVPQNKEWERLIEECYGHKAKKIIRYALKKEPDVFDREKLRRAAKARLPEGCSLKLLDQDLFFRCKKIPWCRDWVAQYKDYERYKEHGLGAVIVRDGEPISGASSYAGYPGGIEIQIDTREDWRRRGLAYVCSARLILECLRRGWYPDWDAQNKWSVDLAEKLGYHFSHEYTAYEEGFA